MTTRPTDRRTTHTYTRTQTHPHTHTSTHRHTHTYTQQVPAAFAITNIFAEDHGSYDWLRLVAPAHRPAFTQYTTYAHIYTYIYFIHIHIRLPAAFAIANIFVEDHGSYDCVRLVGPAQKCLLYSLMPPPTRTRLTRIMHRLTPENPEHKSAHVQLFLRAQ